MIRSLKNPRIKQAIRLRERKWRKQTGQFIIDGCREIGRAVQAGVEFVEAFVCLEMIREDHQAIVNSLSEMSCTITEVSQQVFEKLAFGNRLEGIVAVATIPHVKLDQLKLPETNPCVAVVESLEKPGNLGAILRSADGAGIDGLIVIDPVTDIYNPNVVRASLGTIFSVSVCRATAPEARTWLDQNGFRIYAASLETETTYYECNWKNATAIVLGSEAHGVSENWSGKGTELIKIPMLGIADSLNVSVAASILFYDVLRQRSSS